MLDFFTIFSKGGILLWCFKGADLLQKDWDAFTPAVNSFIKTVLLQEKSGNRTSQFESGSLALKYRLDNEFELVFIAAFQKMLPLLYLDKLLDEIQLLFRDKFSKHLQENQLFSPAYNTFSPIFDATLKKVESTTKKSSNAVNMKSFDESEKSKKTLESMIVKTDTSSTNNNTVQTKKKSKATPSVTFSPKVRETIAMNDSGNNTNESDDSGELDEKTIQANLAKMAGKKGSKGGKSPKPQKPAKQGKQKTTWDPFTFGGAGAKGQEAAELDRSSKDKGRNGENQNDNSEPTDHQLHQFVPDLTVRGKSSQLEGLEVDQTDSSSEEEDNGAKTGKGYGGIWSSLSGLVGSKPLNRKDIEPLISKMQDHLMAKNVAADVAKNICDSVTNKLEGKICGTFQSVQGIVKESMNTSLMDILTPSRRVDIIRDVREAKANNRPYVITFCGVNGVGKSTNLAKICFWLIENKCRVLIAACDTFRAGAVEQLRTHVRRLNSLYPSESNGKSTVELYEKGYGKDAAGIAMEAINYARTSKCDVVLVDTAGRMQDNEPLMRSLAKLITVNDPDLVLFVGEALVGNEAVDQLVKFNQALSDYSPSKTNPHLIDGIVLTKFDTIDDKVGSAISMTYITGQPILFVGTGQTYTDLKLLNAKSVVQSLTK